MYGYTWIQWLFFFYLYCFFGWCFESAYVSIKSKRLVNRGFIRGPFLPLYGSGALMMLIVSMPFRDSLVLTYLAGCVGATALEYVTGVVMESLFKVRYWDYSQNRFNFQGQICLGSTLAWGGLTILMTHVIHGPVERLVLSIPEGILTAVTMLITVGFVADFTLSFKAALELRDVLVRLEQARQELERMQRRLDVIAALADEAVEKKKAEFTGALEEFAQRRDEFVESVKEGAVQRRDELKESMKESAAQRQEAFAKRQEAFARRQEDLIAGIERRFAYLREKLPYSEALREKWGELAEMRESYRNSLSNREHRQYLRDGIWRGMLKGNPGMVSRRFADALEELKQSAMEYGKKRHEEKK